MPVRCTPFARRRRDFFRTRAGTVEHGQRPEVARAAVGRQAPEVDRVREGLDVGAPVVHDDALGPARRARRVVERERVPLVLGWRPRRRRVAARYQRLIAVGAAADDDQGRRVLERRERLAARRLVALVGDEEPRVAVLEDVRDRRGVEARVHAAERRAGHGDALLGLDHLGRVVEHALDDVAAPAALLAEGVAELRAAVVELRPRPRAVAVDDRGAVGEDVPVFFFLCLVCTSLQLHRPPSLLPRGVLVHLTPSTRRQRAGPSRAWRT